MTGQRQIITRWAWAAVAACALAAGPAWCDTGAPGATPESAGTLDTAALQQVSLASQSLYKKVSASLFRVKLDLTAENALPPKFRKEFEDWREKFLKERPAATTAPSEGNLSVTIEPREGPPGPGGRRMQRLANATQPFGGAGVLGNYPLMRHFLEQRLQAAGDLESSMGLRQALLHLEALRNAQSNEALGVVVDGEGYALVLSPLIQVDPETTPRKPDAGEASVTITNLDGAEAKAALIGTDLGRGYSVIKLEKPAAAAVGLADGKPAPGEILMCLNASHGSVGWISVPAPAATAGGPGRKGEERFAVFGTEEHTPVYLFNLNGQLAAMGTDRHAASVEGLKKDWENMKATRHLPTRRPFGVKYDVVGADSPFRAQFKNLGNRPALRVTGVFKGTAAERADIRTGDILLTVDGQPITALQELMRARHAGGPVRLGLLRDDKEITIDLAPDKGEKPEKPEK